MTDRYREILFTPAVREAQADNGSAEMMDGRFSTDGGPDELTPAESMFIAARDSFYISTVSASGWPYMQHRGGPRGFVKTLGSRTLGIADYAGNRQYMSVGNLATNSRAALFFMDYANRRRLKVLAHARAISLGDDPDLIAKLSDKGYRARLERGLIFEVEAFDWNCPQHITPRFTLEEIRALAGQPPATT